MLLYTAHIKNKLINKYHLLLLFWLFACKSCSPLHKYQHIPYLISGWLYPSRVCHSFLQGLGNSCIIELHQPNSRYLVEVQLYTASFGLGNSFSGASPITECTLHLILILIIKLHMNRLIASSTNTITHTSFPVKRNRLVTAMHWNI